MNTALNEQWKKCENCEIKTGLKIQTGTRISTQQSSQNLKATQMKLQKINRFMCLDFGIWKKVSEVFHDWWFIWREIFLFEKSLECLFLLLFLWGQNSKLLSIKWWQEHFNVVFRLGGKEKFSLETIFWKWTS